MQVTKVTNEKQDNKFSQKKNLIGLSEKELYKSILELKTPEKKASMRTKQLWSWIYCHGKKDFSSMSNIDKVFRGDLEDNFSLSRLKIENKEISSDGTVKYLFSLQDNSKIETVFIPEKKRSTLCISSQVGCTLNCSFCHTGTQKLVRNLTAEEIVGQLIAVYDDLDHWEKIKNTDDGLSNYQIITNIVFMGMGEPLLNYTEVKKAIMVLMNNKGLDFSRRRITLSTAGVVPLIKRAHDELGCMIAISLHATEDKTRNILVPLNKKWPINTLIKTLKDDIKLRNSERITFEYVMLKDVNDSEVDAKRLVKIIQGLPSKINLIPFNRWTGSQYQRSPERKIQAFSEIIKKAGFPSPVRAPRGEDIMAACGQLKSSTQKKRLNNA